LSLVDPDNRRPIDFDLRRTLLDEIEHVLGLGCNQRAPRLAEILDQWHDGRIKLLTTAAGLRLRRSDQELFLSGSYVPLTTDITVDGDAIAFARIHDHRAALMVAPRLCARLEEVTPPAAAGTGRPHLPSRAQRRRAPRNERGR
jgi:(1->4)-alpha-D-glucan 1-alpha-D-glucosylmutase